MNERRPFTAADLAELDMRLLDRATQVIAMEDVHDGNRDPRTIAMRHDVDAGHALATAVKIARWEHHRGYRSTYYILHTAPYWQAPGFEAALHSIEEYGHEIGIHVDALAEAMVTGEDPDVILDDAIQTLRQMGFRIRGAAGHGNPLCNRDRAPGEKTFANDEQFVECARPKEGPPDRMLTRGNISLRLKPRPLADFGLEYEGLWVAHPWPFRISDSGGRWLNPGWEETIEKWTDDRGKPVDQSKETKDLRQLHFLLHPDWWAKAFTRKAVAA